MSISTTVSGNMRLNTAASKAVATYTAHIKSVIEKTQNMGGGSDGFIMLKPCRYTGSELKFIDLTINGSLILICVVILFSYICKYVRRKINKLNLKLKLSNLCCRFIKTNRRKSFIKIFLFLEKNIFNRILKLNFTYLIAFSKRPWIYAIYFETLKYLFQEIYKI